MIVHALTYCPHPISAYGNLLVFDSIRKGFPTAQIEVWDNESCLEVREAIQAAASRAGADFHPMRRVHYTDHLRWVLLEREHPKGVPLVLCDPDVAFWDTVQDWDFGDRLMAGRLMPIIRRGGPIALPGFIRRCCSCQTWPRCVARLDRPRRSDGMASASVHRSSLGRRIFGTRLPTCRTLWRAAASGSPMPSLIAMTICFAARTWA